MSWDGMLSATIVMRALYPFTGMFARPTCRPAKGSLLLCRVWDADVFGVRAKES